MLIVALSIFTIGTGISQSTEGKQERKSDRAKLTLEERVERQTKRMTKQLDLTNEQVEKLQAIQLEYAKQEEIEREARAAKRATHEANIRAMLTDEQVKKFDELKENRKDKRARKRNKRKGKRKEMKKDQEGDNLNRQ